MIFSKLGDTQTLTRICSVLKIGYNFMSVLIKIETRSDILQGQALIRGVKKLLTRGVCREGRVALFTSELVESGLIML